MRDGFSPLLFLTIASQERIIERLKEQRERDDRERLEEIESFRKENKDLKEKVNALQAELTEKEVSLEKQMNLNHFEGPHKTIFTVALRDQRLSLRNCVKIWGT